MYAGNATKINSMRILNTGDIPTEEQLLLLTRLGFNLRHCPDHLRSSWARCSVAMNLELPSSPRSVHLTHWGLLNLKVNPPFVRWKQVGLARKGSSKEFTKWTVKADFIVMSIQYNQHQDNTGKMRTIKIKVFNFTVIIKCSGQPRSALEHCVF